MYAVLFLVLKVQLSHKRKIIAEYGSRKMQSDKHDSSCLGFTKQSYFCICTDKPGLNIR